MSDETSPLNNNVDASIHHLFWLSLFFGAISGGLSYFILRFLPGLTWYVLAPVLYIINYVCIYFILSNLKPSESKYDFKSIMKFTGTWIIVYFAVGTAIFYFGW